MGCTYVKEFDFGPAKTHVRGYSRGGPVKKADCECAVPAKEARGGATEEAKGAQKVEAGMLLPKRRGVPVAPKGPLIVIALSKGKPGK